MPENQAVKAEVSAVKADDRDAIGKIDVTVRDTVAAVEGIRSALSGKGIKRASDAVKALQTHVDRLAACIERLTASNVTLSKADTAEILGLADVSAGTRFVADAILVGVKATDIKRHVKARWSV